MKLKDIFCAHWERKTRTIITSLKRMILGCRSDLWLMISLATFSSIWIRKVLINSSIFIKLENTKPKWLRIQYQSKLNKTHTDAQIYLVTTLDIFHSNKFFGFPVSHKPGNTKITRSYIFHNLILLHFLSSFFKILSVSLRIHEIFMFSINSLKSRPVMQVHNWFNIFHAWHAWRLIYT